MSYVRAQVHNLDSVVASRRRRTTAATARPRSPIKQDPTVTGMGPVREARSHRLPLVTAMKTTKSASSSAPCSHSPLAGCALSVEADVPDVEVTQRGVTFQGRPRRRRRGSR